MVRAIKQAPDPLNILNPGNIFKMQLVIDSSLTRGSIGLDPAKIRSVGGLSPLARGNRGQIKRADLAGGSIPARAGEPDCFCSLN